MLDPASKTKTKICGFVLAILFSACGKTSQQSVNAPSSGKAGAADADPTPDQGPDSDISEYVEGKFITAHYSVKANVLGMGVCDGEVDIAIDPGLGGTAGKLFDLQGGMTCMGQELDFAKMLNGNDTGQPPVTEISDHVMGFKQLGPLLFEPARPFFPIFIATKKKDLRSLSVSRSLQMQNQATGEAGSGEVAINVTEFEMSYNPPAMVRTFKNSMRYNVTTSGFDTVKDKFSNMLFDRIEMVISLDPIAIPYILFQGKVNDAMAAQQTQGGGGGGGGIGDMLGGGGAIGGVLGGGPLGGVIKALIPIITDMIDVKVEFDMMSMEGIKDTSFDDEDADIEDDLSKDD